MPFIQTLASIIVVAIENKRFSKKVIDSKKEMELAVKLLPIIISNKSPK